LETELLDQVGAALDQGGLQCARIHLPIKDVKLRLADVRQGAGAIHARRAAADDRHVQPVAAVLPAGARTLREHEVTERQGLRAVPSTVGVSPFASPRYS